MITRSPPPRRVQPAPPQPPPAVIEPDDSGPQAVTVTETSSSSNNAPVLNSSTSASSSSFSRIRDAATAIAASAQNAFSSSTSGYAVGSGGGTPRRPEDAQSDYWKKQMTAVIAQRDDAIQRAAIIDETRTLEINGLRENYAVEKRDWLELYDVVCFHLRH